MSSVSFDLVSSFLNHPSYETSENIKPNSQNNTSLQNTYKLDSLIPLTSNIDDNSSFFIGFIKPYKTFNKPSSETLTSKNLEDSYDSVGSNLKDNVKGVFKRTLSSAGSGALASGGKSLIKNTIAYATGKEKIGEAKADVFGTTIRGAIGGGTGGLTSSICLLTTKLLGFSGTPLIIADILGNAVGVAVGNKAYDSSGIGKKIRFWFRV